MQRALELVGMGYGTYPVAAKAERLMVEIALESHRGASAVGILPGLAGDIAVGD